MIFMENNLQWKVQFSKKMMTWKENERDSKEVVRWVYKRDKKEEGK